MKDWNQCIADKTMLIQKHYTPGGRGRKINKIVLHHNAGNLTIEDCYRVWQTREASAHYQVQTDGTIGQLVNDWDIAWHAGNWNANQTSIGIEHADDSYTPWRISAQCLDNGAHLVAALCKLYKLGRPQWHVNVFPHSYFTPTACPASIQNEQQAEYMNRAQYWYDIITGQRIAQPTPQAQAGRVEQQGDILTYRVHLPWGVNSGQIITFTKLNRVVTVNGCGNINCGGGSWLKAWETIPEEFTPISLATINLAGEGASALMVKPDGTIYYDGPGKHCFTHVTGAWHTNQ